MYPGIEEGRPLSKKPRRDKRKLHSIEITCPRCQTDLAFKAVDGDAFECEVCALDFEIEGGEAYYEDTDLSGPEESLFGQMKKKELKKDLDSFVVAFNPEDARRAIDNAMEVVEELVSSRTDWVATLGKHARLCHILLSEWWEKKCELSEKAVTAITFALLYLIDPADVIPDQTPLIGWLDDAYVMKICINLVRDELHECVESRGWKLEDHGLR